MQVDSTSFVSPNHSGRGSASINVFVIHATVGDALSSLQHLCNPTPINPTTRQPDPKLAVSIHYLITKQGKIYQLVAESEAAWHAGASRWRDMNSVAIRDGSIGIELENRNNGTDPYPPAQFNSLVALMQDILTRHPLPLDHIVSHAQIAIPAGRKTDPKGFDFGALRRALLPPVSLPTTYRTVGLPIYQRQDLTGPLAGHLHTGDLVEVDATYPNGGAHLKDARGFVDVNGLAETQ